MRTRVDAKLCQGHALCQYQAPEVFLLDDDEGHAYVVENEVPKELEDKVMRAAQGCPERSSIDNPEAFG